MQPVTVTGFGVCAWIDGPGCGRCPGWAPRSAGGVFAGFGPCAASCAPSAAVAASAPATNRPDQYLFIQILLGSGCATSSNARATCSRAETQPGLRPPDTI